MNFLRILSVTSIVLALSWGSAEAAEQDAGAAGAAPAAESPAEGKEADFRDPFRPFNLSLQPVNPGPPKTPLEQYELGSLTLVAVIWNVSSPKAMVEDDAGLGYTVGVGTPIGRNRGMVKAIEPGRIIIEEQSRNFFNEIVTTEKVLELQTEEGENKR